MTPIHSHLIWLYQLNARCWTQLLETYDQQMALWIQIKAPPHRVFSV